MNEIEFVDILDVEDGLKEKVREWRNRDDIRRYMLTQHIISKEEHSQWLKRLKEERSAKFWVVFAEGMPIGAAHLHGIDYKKQTSEWGFYIGDSALRGKGMGSRILSRLLDKAFGEIKIKTLFTKVLSDNIRALNIYNKFHFKEIDKLKFENGREVTVYRFDKGDWEKLKKGSAK